MSERPCFRLLKRSSRDARLGKRTLSSFALPIFDIGSSWSLNMLNRAERFGIKRLVRKSSVFGRACARSISGLGSGAGCFFFLKVREENEGREGTGSLSIEGRLLPSLPSPADFFLDRKRFIVVAALEEVGRLLWPHDRRWSKISDRNYQNVVVDLTLIFVRDVEKEKSWLCCRSFGRSCRSSPCLMSTVESGVPAAPSKRWSVQPADYCMR